MCARFAPPFTRGVTALVALLLALGAGTARAQTDTYDSLAGAWWFSLAGKDAGSLLVELSEPSGGQFTVEDVQITGYPSFGFSRTLGAFFVIAAGEPELHIDSKGQISGTIELLDGTTPVAELVVERGKPNKKFTQLNLRASLEREGEAAVLVTLKGSRVPATFPVLTGGNPQARLGGQGVRSQSYDLEVRTNSEFGLPAYDFSGGGAARIDNVEVPDVVMNGRVMLSPRKHVFGLLDDSSDFGSGAVKGTLQLPGTSLIPKVNLSIQADRRVRAFGSLTQPVEQVLAVAPASYDFGGVPLDETESHGFQVSNVGVGELTGTASLMSGSSTDFTIVSTASYGPLENGDAPATIEVEFAPSGTGVRTARVLFSVDGGAGARIVEVRGTGGVPDLSVVPDVGVFGTVTVGQSETRLFEITNDGDGILEGVATIDAPSDYALLLVDGGQPVNSIPYSIDPSESLTIRVRFAPTAVGSRVGSLRLSVDGGADVVVPLTGSGQAAP